MSAVNDLESNAKAISFMKWSQSVKCPYFFAPSGMWIKKKEREEIPDTRVRISTEALFQIFIRSHGKYAARLTVEFDCMGVSEEEKKANPEMVEQQCVAWIKEMPGMVDTGKTKLEAFEQLMISLKVKLAYDNNIDIRKQKTEINPDNSPVEFLIFNALENWQCGMDPKEVLTLFYQKITEDAKNKKYTNMSIETKFLEKMVDLFSDTSFASASHDANEYSISYERLSLFFRNQHRMLVAGEFNEFLSDNIQNGK